MNREITPEAFFDSLYIGMKLQDRFQDFSMYEIQFFAYLACLLSLYDGKPLSFWEYNFVKTKQGSPYSTAIHLALEDLELRGDLLNTEDDYMAITEKGASEIEFYSSLFTMQERLPYLEAACGSLSMIPYGLIRKAVSNEPVLKSALSSISRRFLLDETSPATQALYNQFNILREALSNKYENLLVPAVVWIEAINRRLESIAGNP